MKKFINLCLILLCFMGFPNLISMNEIEEMKPILQKYAENTSKNPKELFEHSMNLSLTLTPSIKEKVNNFLIDNQLIITALTQKSNSLEEAYNMLDNLLDSNPTLSNHLFVSNENCRMFINDTDKQYSIVFSTPALRASNLKEKFGCFCKPMTEEQEASINNAISKTDTFQHISRFAQFELFEKIKAEKNLSLVYTPTLYLIKLPWVSEDRIADDTCIILEETISNIQPVDNTFTSSMNNEQVRQMYEIVKGVGIWNLKNHWFVDQDRKMYIIGMQQQSKTSPENFLNPVDPLLNIREGIKSLASYFPVDSKQFGYLIDAIQNDNEINSKQFMQTLINKAYESQKDLTLKEEAKDSKE